MDTVKMPVLWLSTSLVTLKLSMERLWSMSWCGPSDNRGAQMVTTRFDKRLLTLGLGSGVDSVAMLPAPSHAQTTDSRCQLTRWKHLEADGGLTLHCFMVFRMTLRQPARFR